MQPWIIGVLLALLVATGIGIVLVLTDDSLGVADPPTPGAPGAPDNPANPGNSPAADPREVPSPPTDCLVECSGPEGPDGSPAPGGNYTGSDDAAADFVDAADSTLDAVVFDLETDIGDVLVEVYVVEEGSALTVCG